MEDWVVIEKIKKRAVTGKGGEIKREKTKIMTERAKRVISESKSRDWKIRFASKRESYN